jgi:mono/diheme cytochrome c family protein
MKRAVFVLVGSALLLASPALGQDTGSLKAIYEGRALYVAHCAGCHGGDARGAAWGTDGNGIPDLTRIAERDGGWRAIHVANSISGRHNGDNPKRTMPCWVRSLKEEWPQGDAMGQLKVAWLTQYLAAVQQPRVASR